MYVSKQNIRFIDPEEIAIELAPKRALPGQENMKIDLSKSCLKNIYKRFAKPYFVNDLEIIKC